MGSVKGTNKRWWNILLPPLGQVRVTEAKKGHLMEATAFAEKGSYCQTTAQHRESQRSLWLPAAVSHWLKLTASQRVGSPLMESVEVSFPELRVGWGKGQWFKGHMGEYLSKPISPSNICTHRGPFSTEQPKWSVHCGQHQRVEWSANRDRTWVYETRSGAPLPANQEVSPWLHQRKRDLYSIWVKKYLRVYLLQLFSPLKLILL